MNDSEKTMEMNDTLTIYEVGFLFDPALTEEKLNEEVSAFKTVLSEKGGVVISEEFPKKRDLAYTMIKSVMAENKRFSSAYFGWIKFELTPSSITDIKAWCEKKNEIIRFLITKTVRENTLVSQKASFVPRTDSDKTTKREVPKVQEGAVPSSVSEEELNKSIEKLIV